MAQIDLDAAKAARREAKKQAPSIKFGGKRFVLPVELPFEVAEQLASMDPADTRTQAAGVVGIVKTLLGTHWEAFKALQPSMDDINALTEGALGAYGLDEGNSQASPVSSSNTGTEPRPPSLQSTG